MRGFGSTTKALTEAVTLAVLAASAGLVLGCGGREEASPSAADLDLTSYRQEIEAWQRQRLDNLTKEDGWLTLVGLDWLEEGANTVGSDPASTVVLPDSAPALLGTLHLAGGEAELELAPDVAADVTVGGDPAAQRTVLQSDASGDPDEVQVGTVQFYLIEREGRLGVRLKDSASPTLRDFAGIDTYPLDPAWRFEARFLPYDPPKPVPVPNVLGNPTEEASPGAVELTVGGETYQIDALPGGDAGELFLVFGDATNGKETYGGGRFLYTVPPDADGRVIVDFNKAYNPPCAFTPYATCPLPPPQNKLAVAVTAGEKKYGSGHH